MFQESCIFTEPDLFLSGQRLCLHEPHFGEYLWRYQPLRVVTVPVWRAVGSLPLLWKRSHNVVKRPRRKGRCSHLWGGGCHQHQVRAELWPLGREGQPA